MTTRRLLAEYLGSAFLAALVVGSGIAAQRLSRDPGLQLLENAAATAAGLFAIILMFGPVSGAHLNPVVTLVDAAFGGVSRRDALAYIPAQIAGCISGAVAANAMFALSAVSLSATHRASPSHLFAEVIATLGLVLVIFALARSGRAFAGIAPASVPAFVVAQGVGGLLAIGAVRILYPDVGPATAAEIVVPHHAEVAGADDLEVAQR